MIRRRLAELGERVAALEARLAELERRDAPTEWTAVPEARDGPLELELDGRPLPVWAPAAPTVPLEDDPDEERFRAQRSPWRRPVPLNGQTGLHGYPVGRRRGKERRAMRGTTEHLPRPCLVLGAESDRLGDVPDRWGSRPPYAFRPRRIRHARRRHHPRDRGLVGPHPRGSVETAPRAARLQARFGLTLVGAGLAVAAADVGGRLGAAALATLIAFTLCPGERP